MWKEWVNINKNTQKQKTLHVGSLSFYFHCSDVLREGADQFSQLLDFLCTKELHLEIELVMIKKAKWWGWAKWQGYWGECFSKFKILQANGKVASSNSTGYLCKARDLIMLQGSLWPTGQNGMSTVVVFGP